MNMLYGEIDRLSTAWSTLDEQNSAKVFNLVHLEEKVQRLNTDVRLFDFLGEERLPKKQERLTIGYPPFFFSFCLFPSCQSLQKAKADNRYFATMRQKDAIAAENTVLTKLAEKQQRAVDGVNDLQHSLNTQLVSSPPALGSDVRCADNWFFFATKRLLPKRRSVLTKGMFELIKIV